MKIISLKTGQEYDINPRKNGENSMPCPECSQYRKNKSAKSFSWNNDKQAGYCQNCQTAFTAPHKSLAVDYAVPEWKNITKLSDKAVKFFESRMIDQSTLLELKVYSDNEWMPQYNGVVETICFPYFYNGNLRNIKYRGAEKTFKLFKNGELIFWNLDCVENSDTVVIVEGEIDLLSYYGCGVKNVVSVPNGASGTPSYATNYLHLFDGKTIILAVDNDLAGLKLRTELIKIFGAEKCLVVNFKDVKDANEYLIKYGGIELVNTIKEATAAEYVDVDSPISRFNKSLITLDTAVSPPAHVVQILERGAGRFEYKRFQTLGNMSLLQGKQKAGKTYLLSVILPSIINGGQYQNFYGSWVSPDKAGVLYYDTEQSDFDGQQVFKRIIDNCSQHQNFEYSLLREYEPKERLEIIHAGLKKYDGSLCYVVIDGAADLLYSLNDEEAAVKLVTTFMKWTKQYNVHICTVVHQNKGSNDAQGWLGTVLYKKVETVFSVFNDPTDYSVKKVNCEMQRGTKMFNPFSFTIHSGGYASVNGFEVQDSLNNIITPPF